MKQRSMCLFGIFGMSIATIVGCQQPRIDLSSLPPGELPRHAEMRKLDMLVGEWTGRASIKTTDSTEVKFLPNTIRMAWDLDDRFLVEHSRVELGDGDIVRGSGFWRWDPELGKYRMWWFDSTGVAAEGTATFDEKSRTWHVTTNGKSLVTGQKTKAEGSATFENDHVVNVKSTVRDAQSGKVISKMTDTKRLK